MDYGLATNKEGKREIFPSQRCILCEMLYDLFTERGGNTRGYPDSPQIYLSPSPSNLKQLPSPLHDGEKAAAHQPTKRIL